MEKIIRKNAGLVVYSFLIALLFTTSISAVEVDNEFQPMVAKQFLQEAKKIAIGKLRLQLDSRSK